MPLELRFTVPNKLYLRDPQDTEYGKRLLKASVDLFAEIGFESFTFKKLAVKMESSEVSIYRYFENKHLILLYLYCWYWEWINYLIDVNTRNIQDANKKLKIAIHKIVFASHEEMLTSYIDEKALQFVLINESSKAYHIHDIDKENKLGFFVPFKRLVEKLADTLLEVNPKFKFPRSLSTTIFEMIRNQQYYALHLPRLSDIKNSKKRLEETENMIEYFLKRLLRTN